LRELATSGVLAGNVRSTLRIPEHFRRRLSASIRPNAQVIVVSASDRSADRACQIAQKAAIVLTWSRARNDTSHAAERAVARVQQSFAVRRRALDEAELGPEPGTHRAACRSVRGAVARP